MEAAPRDHLIVAVDFGMTCTGVAWCKVGGLMEDPHILQKWPGKGHVSVNKVPSAVGYTNGGLTSWGFQSTENAGKDEDVQHWFKRFLDPAMLLQEQKDNPDHAPRNDGEVDRWLTDYLSQVYKQIEKTLRETLSGRNWVQAQIEFIFSVPTTWTKQGIIRRFEGIIRKAGFGHHENHSLSIGLTEAEAAAVYTFETQERSYKDGEVILVCDAGGGTTDFSVLCGSKKGASKGSLKQLDVVKGINVGSVDIDYAFEEMIAQRLLRSCPKGRAYPLASQMIKSSKFENMKCEFGEDMDIPQYKLRTDPSLGSNLPASSISDSQMVFSREEVAAIFDEQASKIHEEISRQIARLKEKRPNDQVSYIVLSGGLGSSRYLLDTLRRKFGQPNQIYQDGRSIEIITSRAPQLAVVKGLVLDRLSKIAMGQNILTARCCRASYGVLLEELHNPKFHVNQPVRRDPMDGKVYATDQIQWFIKRGQAITKDFEEIPVRRLLLPFDARTIWTTRIAESKSTFKQPPKSLSDGNAHVLCKIHSDLRQVPLSEFEEVKKKWWKFTSKKKHHFKANYKIRMVIGPADVQFQLWFKGKRYDKPEGGSISVEFDDMELTEAGSDEEDKGHTIRAGTNL